MKYFLHQNKTKFCQSFQQMTDWDRYAAQEYELLVAEEGGDTQGWVIKFCKLRFSSCIYLVPTVGTNPHILFIVVVCLIAWTSPKVKVEATVLYHSIKINLPWPIKSIYDRLFKKKKWDKFSHITFPIYLKIFTLLEPSLPWLRIPKLFKRMLCKRKMKVVDQWMNVATVYQNGIHRHVIELLDFNCSCDVFSLSAVQFLPQRNFPDNDSHALIFNTPKTFSKIEDSFLNIFNFFNFQNDLYVSHNFRLIFYFHPLIL